MNARNKITAFYLLLLMAHVAHVLEEIYGNFRMIGIVGIGWFMVINWVLICIPVAVFYFILQGKRWAYYCGIIYAAIMIINGLIHNIGYFIIGKYYGGVAGCFTGLAFLVIGSVLIAQLWKGMRE